MPIILKTSPNEEIILNTLFQKNPTYILRTNKIHFIMRISFDAFEHVELEIFGVDETLKCIFVQQRDDN